MFNKYSIDPVKNVAAALHKVTIRCAEKAMKRLVKKTKKVNAVCTVELVIIS